MKPVMKRLFRAFLALAAIGVGSAAWAGSAYTQGFVNLRAGPSSDYPLVYSIPPDSLLNVNGCLDDWTWCDVDWEGNRGWVYGDYLYYDHDNRRVPVLQFGASLGIGIVGFTLGDYWGRYYRTRPWYGRQSYWSHRPPPPRRPRPRPPIRPNPPPRPMPPVRPRPPIDRPSPGRPRPPGNDNGNRPPRPEVRPVPRPAPRPTPRPEVRPAPPPRPDVRPTPRPGPRPEARPSPPAQARPAPRQDARPTPQRPGSGPKQDQRPP